MADNSNASAPSPTRVHRQPPRNVTPLPDGASAQAQAQQVAPMTNAQLAAYLTAVAGAQGSAQVREAMLEAGARLSKIDGGATAAERAIPLYLDSNVDVMRDDPKSKDGSKKTVRIAGGQFVSDTDLTEDEIDEFTTHRAIRFATHAEIAADAAKKKAIADQDAAKTAAAPADATPLSPSSSTVVTTDPADAPMPPVVPVTPAPVAPVGNS